MAKPSGLMDRVAEDARGICRRLREKGKRGWIVGGCVRDLLLGRDVSDWDIATDALPHEVTAMFRKVVPTGIAHGTVTVLLRGRPYEVTTLRGEGAYSDGRRPDTVEFVSDLGADLARRDFTINAMALDPLEDELVDPFGGARDLAARRLRAVGDPRERFAEDGLRVLRAARLSATLECEIEEATERAIPGALDVFRKVSAERVRDEWLKAMTARRPSRAFEVMRRTSMLAVTCPELLESVGCAQNRFHAFDVWGHTLATLDACEGDPVLRLAALLHDVGKPRSRAFSDRTHDYTFYEHERIGAELAEPLLVRLRLSNDDRERVVHLVRHHLICYSDEWTDAAVRRWLRRVAPERVDDLYRLAVADARGKGREVTEEIALLGRLLGRVEAIQAAGDALTVRDLVVDGNDLLRELSLRPGPVVGQILAHLVEVVTDEPAANERGRLLEEARAFFAARAP